MISKRRWIPWCTWKLNFASSNYTILGQGFFFDSPPKAMVEQM